MNTKKRPYASSRFCLELGKDSAGWLLTAEGGQSAAEIVSERVATGYSVRKHPGNVKTEELTITCGSSMSEQFYDWMHTSLEYKHERKHGALITLDYDFKELVRLEFFETLISEVGLPAVDAASKDACKFTLKLAPEHSQTKFSNGTQSMPTTPIDPSKQKMWHAANFRFDIDGIDCQNVNKVEALTIKQNLVENAVGERLIYQKEPAQIDFPNIVFTIPEAFAAPFYKWYDDFVCKGNSSPTHEKHGHLEYLAPDCKTVLFVVDFKQLGIVKYHPEKLDSASDKLRNVKIEMYCESMGFKYESAGKHDGSVPSRK